MNFSISKRPFYNALASVARAISPNSPIPALSGIRIDVLETHLVLTASDANISIQKQLYPDEECHMDIRETGSVVIDSRYLLEIVRKMDADEIHLEILDGALTRISGHLAEYKINGIAASQYPNIDFSHPDQSFRVARRVLATMINQTVFAASDRETKPVLTGVNWSADGHSLMLVATDSYRLARKFVDLPESLHFNVTVPARSLQEVAKTMDDETDIDIYISDKKIQFVIDGSLIQSRLIDGFYPETSRLIPKEFAFSLTVETRDFLNAIDRASFIKNDGISIIRLSAQNDEVILSSHSQEVGSSVEKLIPVSYEGGVLDISFSGRYMSEAVRALDIPKVRIDFSGAMKPFLICNPEDDSVVQLVLPVRTYN